MTAPIRSKYRERIQIVNIARKVFRLEPIKGIRGENRHHALQDAIGVSCLVPPWGYVFFASPIDAMKVRIAWRENGYMVKRCKPDFDRCVQLPRPLRDYLNKKSPVPRRKPFLTITEDES